MKFDAILLTDHDGSDNWEEIANADWTGYSDAKTNYPAFNYVSNYGSSYTEDWKDGWYIPTLAEMKMIYENKDTIQSALKKISGFTLATKDSNGFADCYWTSTQNGGDNSYVFKCDFNRDGITCAPKDDLCYVLVLHYFTDSPFFL